jgi:hypothetical protein
MMALIALSSSCSLFQSSAEGAADDLNEFANAGAEATFLAGYQFKISGPLAEGRTTRIQIVQKSPIAIRKVEIVTKDREGNQLTTRSWLASNDKGSYSCTDYAEVGVRCLPNPLASGTFGNAQLDEFFDTPRKEGAYSSVVKTPRSVRIAGEVGTCFEAVPVAPTPPPITSPQPRFVPERFRYDLCYSDDGILLRGRKTIQGEVPENVEERKETIVEALTVSRVVQPQELRLPGPVAGAEDVKP